MATKCDADGLLVRTTYDDFGNVDFETHEIDAPGCPTPEYILATEVATTSTHTLHRNASAPGVSTLTHRESVFGNGATTGTISDYDDPVSDPTPDIPNDWWPVAKVQNEIRFGQTRLIGAGAVAAAYRTSYRYDQGGYVVEGPRAESLTAVTYHEGTTNVKFRDVTVGPGACPGAGCLRTTYENYDALGNPGLVIDPSGLATRYTYNSWNKIAEARQLAAGPGGEDIVTEYRYDGAGDLDLVIFPEGNVVDYDYVGPSLLKSIKRRNYEGGPVLDEITYEYDPEGNRTAERRYQGGAAGGTLTFETLTKYDLYSHVAEVVNGNGASRFTRYSPTGLLLSSTDESGNETAYLYDPLKRLYEVRPPDGGATRYGYDTKDNLTEVAACRVTGCDLSPFSFDPNKVVTRYLYDDFGRLVWSESPDGGVVEFEYDAAGNLTRKMDARGNLAFYAYDAANRLVRVEYTDGVALGAIYHYDTYPGAENAVGRLAAAEDVRGITVYGYDLLGRMTFERRSINYEVDGVIHVRTLENRMRYDRNGTLRALTYPSGITVYYDPDPADVSRLIRVRAATLGGGAWVIAEGIALDPSNQLFSATYGNGTAISRQYDLQGRVTGLQSGPVQRGYEYFANGNIAAIRDAVQPENDQGFLYDPANRLTAAAGGFGVRAYAYDKAGNRLSESSDARQLQYTYAAGSNRLTAVIDPAAATTQLLAASADLSTAADATLPRGKAVSAETQIINDLTDLIFSGRRLMRQALGMGSFSSGQASYHRPSAGDNSQASTAADLFVRKATDTTLLLKAALFDETVTLEGLKTAADGDDRLQDQIDQLFADVETMPTEQALPFVQQFLGVFTLEDVILISQILDLAGGVEIPPELPPLPPEFEPAGRSAKAAAAQPVALSNALHPGDAAWAALVEGLRAIVTAGATRERLDALQAQIAALRAFHVRPSEGIRHAMHEPGVDRLVLRLAANKLGWAEAGDALSVYAVTAAGVEEEFFYDERGNVVQWNDPEGSRSYSYGADGRLYHAEATQYGYDMLGRRVYRTAPSQLSRSASSVEPSTDHQFWSYDTGGQMLEWQRLNLSNNDSEVGEEVIESYIYVNGERFAKIIARKSFFGSGGGGGGCDPGGGGGGGGGGGCCAVTVALQFDGSGAIDLAGAHAVDVLRGFRSEVLSGTVIGEAVIRFYYRDFSPWAIAMMHDLPALKTLGRWVVKASAAVLDEVITPAYAGLADEPFTYQAYWYHNDHLGTPLALSDEQGQVVAEWVRDPFGNVVSKSGTVEDNHMFPGQFWDADANLAYNWNRWYAPEVGRYTQYDPIGIITNGSAPTLLNSNFGRPTGAIPGMEPFNHPFAYVSSNPLIYSDPLGLFTLGRCLKSPPLSSVKLDGACRPSCKRRFWGAQVCDCDGPPNPFQIPQGKNLRNCSWEIWKGECVPGGIDT